jgi:hypothetical protein
MANDGNGFRKIGPAIYTNKFGHEIVNLGEIAQICEKDPKKLWKELFDNDKTRYAFPVSITFKFEPGMAYFYLDQDGHALVPKDNDAERVEDVEDTGLNIGGCEEKTLGDWEDIFIPYRYALELLDRYRNTPELRLETWENIKIYWNGSELYAEARKEVTSAKTQWSKSEF